MSTIGIAIPCYRRHLNLLKRLLRSIEHQSRKPDAVSVSCSSCREEDIGSIDVSNYTFPIHIEYHADAKNAAQNRNIAAKHLKTDIVSFFDADDIMHPLRIQAIMIAFENPTIQFVLHSFLDAPEFEAYAGLDIYESALEFDDNPNSVCLKCRDFRIHHSQVSVRHDCFNIIQFREDEMFNRAEDSVFCREMLCKYPTQNAFIANPLSSYVGEGQTYYDDVIVSESPTA